VSPSGLGAAGPAPRTPGDVVLVDRIVDRTAAEGPGFRCAVWTQGCSVRCPGCFNPHLWSARGGTATSVEDVVARVGSADVEGVTFLGGEPFDQAAALARVAARVRAAGRSVMTFTGYTLEQLNQAIGEGRDDVAALLADTDLLVDGPLLSDRLDHTRPWVGSTNQQFHFLTHRYATMSGTLSMAHRDRVEIRVNADGGIAVNGWADVDTLDTLLLDVAPLPPLGQRPAGAPSRPTPSGC